VTVRRRRPWEEERERDPAPQRRPDPAALLARELTAPARRLESVEAAQRAFGNHAVTRMLARDENPKLEKQRTAPPPRQPLRAGREVDAIFDTSPYFRDLVGAKLKKLTLDKAMKIDDEARFKTAWVDYAKRSHNPVTQKNYTEQEALDFLAKKGLRAFQDEDRGEIHIRKARADLGTQLHEGLHLFAHDSWKRRVAMNYAANEGVTEWFTRKIGPEVEVERDDNSFLREYTSATHLVAAADESVVASAYFEGDIAGLKRKIDGRRPNGAGTWERWLGFLRDEDFKSANKLLTTGL